MKVWFDLSNSPHINMFNDMIRELEKKGNEVIITCRPLANTIDLLNQKNLTYTVVGDHYGKNLLKKIFGYPIRVFQLFRFLSGKKIDVAISQSSFHSPVVAKLLGVPSLYTNDNEHAIGNVPCFMFSNLVLIPENLPIEKIIKKGGSRKRTQHYPGIKEGIYLWKKGEMIHDLRKQRSNEKIRIYIRPEPLTAQYYKGGLNFMDSLLQDIRNKYEVFVLPRDKTQLKHYKQEKFSGIVVPDTPLEFDKIAIECSLFIGAGGSMTREMAILGIPTISVYQDELLEVDKYLIDNEIMIHDAQLNAQRLEEIIKEYTDHPPAMKLMEKGKLAYNMFLDEIYRMGNKK